MALPRIRRRRGRGRGRMRGGRRRRVMAPPRISLLGNSKAVRLKYHASFVLQTNDIGDVSTHVFSASGMFDPDITGIGHQPRGFDQLMSLYSFYTVQRSKLTASFYPSTGLPRTTGGTGSVSLLDTATTTTDQRNVLEDRNVSFRGIPDHRAMRVIVVSKSFDAISFFGVPNPTSTYALRGQQLANPSHQAFFHVSYIPVILGETLEDRVEVQIEMEFVAVLTEPKLPAVS